MPAVMWTDIAFEGTLLKHDSRLMMDQSKSGITGPSVDRALVLEAKYMPTGKGSMLSRTQRLHLGGVEVPQARLLPDRRAPKICSTSGLEGLCVMPASSPTVLLTRTWASGIAVVKLTSSRVNSPPWDVSDGEPSGNNDIADVVVIRAEGVSINNLEVVCSRIGLKLTEMLMHVLPVGESILHGESNCLCSHKTGGRVDNDSVQDMVSVVYLPPMGSLEVGPNRQEELEHGHIEVMLISVQIWRQEPLVERIRMKRVARGRLAGLKLLSCVDIHICSIRNLSSPVLPPAVVSTSQWGLEVLRSSWAPSKICTVFKRFEL